MLIQEYSQYKGHSRDQMCHFWAVSLCIPIQMSLSFIIDSDLLYRSVLKGSLDCIVAYLAIYSQTGLFPNRIKVLRCIILFRMNRMFELSSYSNQISIINWYFTFVLYHVRLKMSHSFDAISDSIWAVYIVYAIFPFLLHQNCLSGSS